MIATPEIVSRQLDPDEPCLILLASDGLWDGLDDKEACEILQDVDINSIDSLETGAMSLLRAARPDTDDDITVVFMVHG